MTDDGKRARPGVVLLWASFTDVAAVLAIVFLGVWAISALAISLTDDALSSGGTEEPPAWLL
jgi:hypothetical protein